MSTETFNGFTPYKVEVNKTSSYGVLITDSGTLFTTGGAATITFTLPSLVLGVNGWWAFLNLQGNNMAITAPANKLVAINNATGTTCTYSTASQLIGAYCEVWMNQAGTFYYMKSAGTQTMTIT